MFFGSHQFPYTNFHELNLDWILEKLKTLLSDNVDIHSALEQLSAAIDAMDENMTQQIHDQLQSMVDDGTFAELLTNYSGFVKQKDTTVAMLADTELRAGVLVQTAGYYEAGDGGQGLFLITTTETSFALANGLYAAILEDIANVLAYGAKADGTTDDTQAVLNAMAVSPVVRFPKRSAAYVFGNITIPEGRQLMGEETEIRANAATLFTIAHGHVALNNFIVRGENYTAIQFNLTEGGQFIYIDDVKAYNCLHLIDDITGQDSQGNEIVYTNTYISRCYGIDVTGTGVHMTKALAFIFLDDVTIDAIRTMPNAPLFHFENCRGIQLRHCEAEGGKTEGHIHQLYNVGFAFKACVAVWLDRCMADTLDGIGFEVANTCEFMYLSQCVASLCGSHAFMLAGKYMTFTNCFANGNRDEQYPLQNVHGFNIYSDVVISGCRADRFTGAAIYVHGTGKTTVTGVMSNWCGMGILGETGATGIIQGCVIDTFTGTDGMVTVPETLHTVNNLINGTFA